MSHNEREKEKQALKEMRNYLEFGEVQQLSKKTGLTPSRAHDILRGKVRPKESDYPFINKVFDLATQRKAQVFDKIHQFIPAA